MVDINDIQKYYDLSVENTADEWYSNDILLPTHIDFLSLLPTKPRILDLGCGAGYESKRLSTLGADIVGIDISPESIRIAKMNNPHCSFITGNFFDLDQSLGTFNGILSSGSLIHVSQDRVVQLLALLKKLLSNKGIFLAILRNGSGQVVSHPIINGITLERIIYLYSNTEIISFFQSAGFTFLRDGILDNSLLQSGWRCYLFANGN